MRRKIIFVYSRSRSRHKAYFEKLKRNLNIDEKIHLVSHRRLELNFCFVGYRTQCKELVLNIIELEQSKRASKNKPPLTSMGKLLLGISSRIRFYSFLAFFKGLPEDSVVCMWNGSGRKLKPIVLAAELTHSKTLFFENGVFKNTTTADPTGVNALSSLVRDSDYYKRGFSRQGAEENSKLELQNRTSGKTGRISKPERYIFVPFQVDSDSQIIRHSPMLNNMSELFDLIHAELDNVIKYNIKFVLKEHPNSRNNYERLHKKSKDIIFINELTTEELIKDSLGVITINSTVGLEAFMLGKSVLILGRAFYDFLHGVRSITELSIPEWVSELDSFSPDRELIDSFTFYLKHHYLIPGDWREPTKEHYIALRKRLLVIIGNPAGWTAFD
ncbi:MAG: capsular polysaccharide export protein [Candidatus Kentron sp. G]|nr:MAG: capsular polysaccharide export protein [Candidatus Kentron sp. G]VFN05319.1 MAG: capsular polysaccharide export protein [Candidatus Kentron sp. G]VFN06419.1 MAG: capsular polysaccharide export protein [Candidatus Kentron sp. G]